MNKQQWALTSSNQFNTNWKVYTIHIKLWLSEHSPLESWCELKLLPSFLRILCINSHWFPAVSDMAIILSLYQNYPLLLDCAVWNFSSKPHVSSWEMKALHHHHCRHHSLCRCQLLVPWYHHLSMALVLVHQDILWNHVKVCWKLVTKSRHACILLHCFRKKASKVC